MEVKAGIIQWNIQGISNKKNEILELVQNFQAGIIALQETKSADNFLPRIPSFNVVSKVGHFNRCHHGGVSIYIHSSIPFRQIEIDTPLQAVAIQVQLHSRFTICNLYNSHSHSFSLSLLQQLFDQLPQPCLIIGDFNAHHPLWGSSTDDTRGRIVEEFLTTNNLIILNNGSSTRIHYGGESAQWRA